MFTKEYKRIIRKENAITKKANEIETLDLSTMSQASACDVLISKLIKDKAIKLYDLQRFANNDEKIKVRLLNIISELNVVFKNKTTSVDVLVRLKRHLLSDTLKRLNKREIALT
jgi:hypothetical protein